MTPEKTEARSAGHAAGFEEQGKNSRQIVDDQGRADKAEETPVGWAMAQRTTHAGAKLVLLILAHHVNRKHRTWTAWPSVPRVAELACMGRTAVFDNLQRLQTLGLVHDTGARQGATRQVIVWRLGNSPDSEPFKGSESEPFHLSKSPDFGGKGSGFRRETVRIPDTEPPMNPEEGFMGEGRAAGADGRLAPAAAAAALSAVELPAGLDPSLFADFAGETTPARLRALVNKAHELAAQGHDVNAMCQQAIETGWRRWPLPPKTAKVSRARKRKAINAPASGSYSQGWDS